MQDLPVEDVMEQLPTVTVDDNLDTVLEQLERHDAVLVSSPHGLQAVAPHGPGTQNAVMDALETVKLHGVGSQSSGAIAIAIRELAADGATALLAGCTEVSLVLQRFPPALPWLDPLTVLAEALVREAGGDPATGGDG